MSSPASNARSNSSAETFGFIEGHLLLPRPACGDEPDAVIAPGLGPTNVIGMNVLSRLQSWRVENNVMILVPHNPQAPLAPADLRRARVPPLCPF